MTGPRLDSVYLSLEETRPAAQKPVREGEAAVHFTASQPRASANESIGAMKEQAFRG